MLYCVSDVVSTSESPLDQQHDSAMHCFNRLIDTPGIHDTRIPLAEVKFELSKLFQTCPEGVHVFLYVHNPSNRFTHEEQECMKHIQVGINQFTYSFQK